MGRFSGIQGLQTGIDAGVKMRKGVRRGVEYLGTPGLRGMRKDPTMAYKRGRRRLIAGGAMAAGYTMVAPPNPNSRAGRAGSGRSSGGMGMLNSRSIGGYA